MVEEPTKTTPQEPETAEEDKKPEEPQTNEELQKLAQSVNKMAEAMKQQGDITKKQFDGIAFKIRQLDERVSKPTTPTTTEQPDDNFNYDENEELKKVKEELNELKEQPKKASLGFVQQAKQRVVAEAHKRGIDLADDFSWNEFVSGETSADDPAKRPLFTHRANPETGLYANSESAYKDMLEHLDKRYPPKGDDNPDKTMDNVADTTPSSDTTANENKSSKRFRLTDEEKAAAKAMGKTEEEYIELKQGKLPEFNLTGEEKL